MINIIRQIQLFAHKKPVLSIIFYSIFLVIVYSLYFFNKIELDNFAYWSGDTISYQSTAVNLSKGHKLKYGAIESYDTYKFGSGRYIPDKAVKDEFISIGQQGGRYRFSTTPGYSYFLGTIYKACY